MKQPYGLLECITTIPYSTSGISQIKDIWLVIQALSLPGQNKPNKAIPIPAVNVPCHPLFVYVIKAVVFSYWYLLIPPNLQTPCFQLPKPREQSPLMPSLAQPLIWYTPENELCPWPCLLRDEELCDEAGALIRGRG